MADEIIPARDNLILAKFCDALNEVYGDRLVRIVLFGSQARGDAYPDSDYDVAVFLNGIDNASDRWVELDRLAALRVKFLDETGIFLMQNPIRRRRTANGHRSCMKFEERELLCDPGSRTFCGKGHLSS